jgi:hypothetical protein
MLGSREEHRGEERGREEHRGAERRGAERCKPLSASVLIYMFTNTYKYAYT